MPLWWSTCWKIWGLSWTWKNLGVLISSLHMSFSLQDSKVLNLQKECGRLLSSKSASQSHLAHLIGKMTAAKAAVSQAPLHYRALQHHKKLLRIPESSTSSKGKSRCRGLVRPGMVGKKPNHSQHQVCETPSPQDSDPVGCFRVGLGGSVQQDRDKGYLVPPRILSSHKLPGTNCLQHPMQSKPSPDPWTMLMS